MSITPEMLMKTRDDRLRAVSDRRKMRLCEGLIIFSMTGERGEDHEGREFIIPPPARGTIDRIRLSSSRELIFDVAFRVPDSLVPQQDGRDHPDGIPINIFACLSEEDMCDVRRYKIIGSDDEYLKELGAREFAIEDSLARPLGLSYGNRVVPQTPENARLGEGYIQNHYRNAETGALEVVKVKFTNGSAAMNVSKLLDPEFFRIYQLETISGQDPVLDSPENHESGSANFNP